MHPPRAVVAEVERHYRFARGTTCGSGRARTARSSAVRCRSREHELAYQHHRLSDAVLV